MKQSMFDYKVFKVKWRGVEMPKEQEEAQDSVSSVSNCAFLLFFIDSNFQKFEQCVFVISN